METLLASINCIGKYIYDMHKESCSIKEDDLGLSSFSFSRNTKPNEEIIERFIVLEKKLEVEMKQGNCNQT